jgi:tRNA-dihydrouridine synthase
MCLKHLDYLLEFQSENQAVLEIRSHVAWYLKGIKGSSKIKNQIFQTKKAEELYKILQNFKKLC